MAMDVRPDSIGQAARKVGDAGQDWGESVGRLTGDMAGAGDPYGEDELGVALERMYDIIGPAALTYFTETGFCLLETASAMNQMAAEYTNVDADNHGQIRRVQTIVERLGEV